MPTQMKRIDHLQAAQWLEYIARSHTEGFDALCELYTFARERFTSSDNDIDPTTIALGLQAQALALKCVCQWLEAVSTVTGPKHVQSALDTWAYVVARVEEIGIVIPDIMTL